MIGSDYFSCKCGCNVFHMSRIGDAAAICKDCGCRYIGLIGGPFTSDHIEPPENGEWNFAFGLDHIDFDPDLDIVAVGEIIETKQELGKLIQDVERGIR